MKKILEEKEREFTKNEDGELYFREMIYVPKLNGVKDEILKEAHAHILSMYPGVTKIKVEF